mgnify:CR=1 FL=1
MSSDFDPTDFVDNDFRAQKLPLATATATATKTFTLPNASATILTTNALVTGARIKIGYQSSLMMLRAAAMF